MSLAQCEDVWDRERSANSYCWDGGAQNGSRWRVQDRKGAIGGQALPTDAEILFGLVLPMEPRDSESLRRAVDAAGGGGGGRAEIAGADPVTLPGKTLLSWLPSRLRIELKQGATGVQDASSQEELGRKSAGEVGLYVETLAPLQLAVVAPAGRRVGSGSPLWRVSAGHWNLPYALVFMAHYVQVARGSGGSGAPFACVCLSRDHCALQAPDLVPEPRAGRVATRAATAARGDTHPATAEETAARKTSLDFIPGGNQNRDVLLANPRSIDAVDAIAIDVIN